ncbi:MAG: cytochrome c-type biogenesis protein CcmH [Myxococcota bacterium]
MKHGLQLASVLALLLAGCEAHEFSSGSARAAAQMLGIDLSQRREVPAAIIEAAKPIGREVVCLCGTCPRRLVTDCECGWARQNQKAIQFALMDGKSGEQIIEAFVKAHGLKARPTPPDDALGKVSWLVPLTATLLAFVVLAWFGSRLRRTTPAPAPAASAEDVAARQLLERELEDLED